MNSGMRKFVNRIRPLCAVVGTLAGFCLHPCAAGEHTRDSLETVKQNVADGKAVLLDVREKKEWDAGHLEGAVLVPISQLRQGAKSEELRAKLSKEKVIYTHCAAGKRALIAGDVLKDLGYEVRCLKPGYHELIEAGFPKAKE